MVIVWNMPSWRVSHLELSVHVWFVRTMANPSRGQIRFIFLPFLVADISKYDPSSAFLSPFFHQRTHSQHFVPREEGSNMKESGSLLSLSTTTFSNQMLRGRKWKKKVRGEKATKKFFFFPFFFFYSKTLLERYLCNFSISSVFPCIFSGACWVLWAPLTSRHVPNILRRETSRSAET